MQMLKPQRRLILSTLLLATGLCLSLPTDLFAADKKPSIKERAVQTVHKLLKPFHHQEKVAALPMSTGAPYVCTPSGFGRKGACVVKAGF